MQDVSGDRGAAMTVRGSRAVRRIVDEHADNGFPRAVHQSVLVDDGGCWQRAAKQVAACELDVGEKGL